jgi:small subunit ribosomal protein S20
MPNIRQQKKRVRTADRQRAENVRYRSTVRTLTRKLHDAAAEGDQDAVQAAHRDLVQWLDRAVTRGALHRNTTARRKAQAAKLVSSPES